MEHRLGRWENRDHVSKRILFETHSCFLIFLEQEGYRLVSKLVSKSKYQNLTNIMSFDTNEI